MYVTGAAGRIDQSFIPKFLKGYDFGNTKIYLKMLGITPFLKVLSGATMEIQDCAYPLCLNLLNMETDPIKCSKTLT